MGRIAVAGAGSVGLGLGARLAAAGHDVIFVTRRAEQAEGIAAEGVELEDPASGARQVVAARATAELACIADELAGAPLVLCCRTADLEALVDAVVEAAPGALPVAAQNGVAADALLAARSPRALGLVVRQTFTRTGDRSVRAVGAGRLVVGRSEAGGRGDPEPLAGLLRSAGFDVGVSADLAGDRWLKLCVNLMSAPNALVRREDHASRDFVELKARLLEEARDVLTRAGIDALSCDGRDRSLDEEIVYQREALARGTSARDIPLYNQVWSALRHGGPLEADEYHRRVLELAETHGIAAPVNARVLARLLSAAREGRGPETASAGELI
ncbi:MAG: 2-dehydropantoate 2-reductase N-terminal domain-containing protein [Myxococcota bacterium]|nr:2-dehydropantoate 2-reductase N-terminal domain-containing protein [Myxococcota bacterium]